MTIDRLHRPPTWTLPIALVVAACGHEPVTSASAGALAGPDIPLEMAVEDVYTVGSLDGEEWELFSRIGRVSFDGDGNLYIYDADNSSIVVVDGRGQHLRTMGGAGDGPGEFRMPMGVAVQDDGTTVVHDIGHQALMLFDSNGFDRSVRMSIEGLMPGPEMLPHPRGGLVSPSTLRIRMGGPDGGDVEEPTTIPVSFFPLDESPPQTLFEAWRMPPPVAEDVTVSGASFQVQTRPMVAFEPQVQFGVFPDGRLAVVDSTAYRVHILDPDGLSLAVLERPVSPKAVTESDREAERSRRLDDLSSGSGPRMRMMVSGGGGGGMPADMGRRIMEQQIANMVFADEIPVVTDLAVDRGGRVWVERSGPEVGEQGPTDLIDSDGTYLGTLAPTGPRIPDAFGPGGLIAYIDADEMDVPHVRVQRLPDVS